MARARVYNPDEVSIIYGATIIEGKGPDTFLAISYSNQQFTMQMNSDGGGTRSKSNDLGATMTVTLAQSSPSNDILSAAFQLDQNTPGGAALPFFVKDNNGTSLYTAEAAWVQQWPDSEFGIESGTREWVFATTELISFVGSNNLI